MHNHVIKIIIVVMAAVTITGCGNDDDGQEPLRENTWRIEGVTYVMVPPLLPHFQGNSLICNLADGSVLSIVFPERPEVSQAYDVIAPSSPLGPSQCKVHYNLTSSSPITLYGSTGRSGDRVSVTVTGGKVRAEINEIEMFYFKNTVRFTATLSANLKEE